MRNLFSAAFVLATAVCMLGQAAQAQDLKSVIPQHKSGETLSYRVVFDGDPQFGNLSLAFYHIGEERKNQSGLTAWFGTVNHFVKVNPGVYDVDGVIPPNMMEGEYQLQKVNTTIGPASKTYEASDLKVSIFIKNDAKYDFPPLKSVTPK
ncbi:MAG: hypothetical protein WCF22_15545 [Candidatus Sulfotelmatobacter sp.]